MDEQNKVTKSFLEEDKKLRSKVEKTLQNIKLEDSGMPKEQLWTQYGKYYFSWQITGLHKYKN